MWYNGLVDRKELSPSLAPGSQICRGFFVTFLFLERLFRILPLDFFILSVIIGGVKRRRE